MYLYSIKDEKVGVFYKPYFLSHDVIAKRMFRGMLRQQDSLMREFPRDYALYRVGCFDEKTGKIEQNEPESLGFAFEFMDVNKDNDDDEEKLG